MKKLLVCSLAANAALAAVYFSGPARWTEMFAAGGGSAPAAVAPAKSAPPAAAALAGVDPATWTELTTGDLPAIAARLKAGGYPLSLQRAILAALISDRFAARHQALADLIGAYPWWRGNLFSSSAGANVVAQRQAIHREEKEAIEELLGPDAGVSDYTRAQRARQNGDLPPAKAGELARITGDYDELIAAVRNSAQNVLLPEDREKIAYLEKEKRTDIAKLLNPDELLDYDLRNSPTAGQLRYQLAAFNASEDEYRAIFKVQQAFDANYGPAELMTPEQRRQRYLPETVAQLNDQIKAVLPADRFADYQAKTDPAYIQANALVTRLQLPEAATSQIVAVQKDITKRAAEVRADKSLAPDQRNLQLTTLGNEAVARLSPTLGADGVAAYQQSGGAWINALQRPPTPPPVRKP